MWTCGTNYKYQNSVTTWILPANLPKCFVLHLLALVARFSFFLFTPNLVQTFNRAYVEMRDKHSADIIYAYPNTHTFFGLCTCSFPDLITFQNKTRQEEKNGMQIRCGWGYWGADSDKRTTEWNGASTVAMTVTKKHFIILELTWRKNRTKFDICLTNFFSVWYLFLCICFCYSCIWLFRRALGFFVSCLCYHWQC